MKSGWIVQKLESDAVYWQENTYSLYYKRINKKYAAVLHFTPPTPKTV